MPHKIKGAPGSRKFFERFRDLREQYIRAVQGSVGDLSIQSCWLISLDADPEPWKGPNSFLDPAEYLSDACNFLRAMIDQGHQVGCTGYRSGDGLELWLGYWEAPFPETSWPVRDSLHFHEIWPGVVRG